MKALLKSLNERVWLSVENGWERLATPVGEWTIAQKDVASFNSKAMNAIFNAVSMEKLKRISNVEVAHIAWHILQTMHEGTKAVKINKLQQLISRFESTRIADYETFDEFYAKLNDIVNPTFNLGDVYDQPKIVRKILRSLTKDFRPKVTVITESKDIDTIPIDEHVGSLQSYESDLPKTNKSKSIIWLGVSTGRVGSGLGSTRNRPDLVGWLDGGPAADCEKSRVESNRALVDSNQIRLQPKDKNHRTNLKQIPQI